MGLKSDIVRIRRVNDLDYDAYLAARNRHAARLVIHEYEEYNEPFYEICDKIEKSIPKLKSGNSEIRECLKINVGEARDRLGPDSPELWRTDQQRIERYLLCTAGNLGDAEGINAWGADPNTMWEHHQDIGRERDRRREDIVHNIIVKRAAVETEKGSPVRFGNRPRYGTPVYSDGRVGDPKLYPRNWVWPLFDYLDGWLNVIDKVEEVTLSDEERLQEIVRFSGKNHDIDFASLFPAPGDQFPKFERIQSIST